MHGMEILPQDFALKMQGGLMHEGGGGICGTLRYKYKATKRATTKQCILTPLNLAIVSDTNSETMKIMA